MYFTFFTVLPVGNGKKNQNHLQLPFSYNVAYNKTLEQSIFIRDQTNPKVLRNETVTGSRKIQNHLQFVKNVTYDKMLKEVIV